MAYLQFNRMTKVLNSFFLLSDWLDGIPNNSPPNIYPFGDLSFIIEVTKIESVADVIVIEVKEQLFSKLVDVYLFHLENQINDWSSAPSRDDEDPIDDLYGYEADLKDLRAGFLSEYQDQKRKELLDEVAILIEMNAPEETIPDSWDRVTEPASGD